MIYIYFIYYFNINNNDNVILQQKINKMNKYIDYRKINNKLQYKYQINEIILNIICPIFIFRSYIFSIIILLIKKSTIFNNNYIGKIIIIICAMYYQICRYKIKI
jgi:hypothetical protein